MDEELEPPKEISTVDAKSLTIKIVNAGEKRSADSSVPSSPYSSALISPPSSAFVSALQSPYISPRATNIIITSENSEPNDETPTPATTMTHPSPPVSYCGSQSDDVPSTSYTPPPERQTFPDDAKLKIVTCVPVPDADPRISFSFPIPRISFAKGSVSPASNAKLRSCDVYVGFHGQNPNLVRFCKWIKSELEIQGIACFVADRAKYSTIRATKSPTGLSAPLHLESFFAQKKNLIPLFFDNDANEIACLSNPHADNRGFKEALGGLMRFHEFELEANESN
ncbi:hypothetical protein OROGR_007181 [Orobanche gracilis]